MFYKSPAVAQILRYKRATTTSGITLAYTAIDNNAGSTLCQWAGSVIVPLLQANDIVLAFYTDNYSGDTINPFISGGATGLSFTQINTVVSSGSNQSVLYWARAAGTETASGIIEIGNNDADSNQESGGVLAIVRGCKTSGNPYEGNATNSSPSSSTVTSASTVTSVANTLGLRFFGKKTSSTSNAPSGWKEEQEGVKTSSSSVVFILDSKAIPTASTESASTRNISGVAGSTSISLAMMPA